MEGRKVTFYMQKNQDEEGAGSSVRKTVEALTARDSLDSRPIDLKTEEVEKLQENVQL